MTKKSRSGNQVKRLSPPTAANSKVVESSKLMFVCTHFSAAGQTA